MSNEIKPLVSVCCLVYNHEPYLRDCFEGFVKQQTTFPFEILVHDDASTDHSADIIREYTAKYPHLFKPIYQTENQYSKGVRITNQYQYPRAQGKYIALCEGDDYWTDPHKLQMQVDWLEEHPEYSMTFHAAILKQENRSLSFAEAGFVQDKDYTADDVMANWIVPTASIIFRKQVLNCPINGESRLIAGDIAIVMKSLAVGKIRGFSNKMSVYRISQKGISSYRHQQKNVTLKYPDHILCLKENFPFISSKIINKCLAYRYWNRAAVQPTLYLALQDRKRAFISSPIVVFLAILEPFATEILLFCSKFINTQKFMHVVRKIVMRKL